MVHVGQYVLVETPGPLLPRGMARTHRSIVETRVAFIWTDRGRGYFDLEAEGAQYSGCAAYAAAEVVGAKWAAGRVPVGNAENGLGVITFVVEDQQIRASGPEAVVGQELILSQPVILGCCLPDMVGLN